MSWRKQVVQKDLGYKLFGRVRRFFEKDYASQRNRIVLPEKVYVSGRVERGYRVWRERLEETAYELQRRREDFQRRRAA